MPPSGTHSQSEPWTDQSLPSRKSGGKGRDLGWDTGDKTGRDLDLSPKLVAQCLLGAYLPCRKETLPGDRGYLCVCSGGISFHLKVSTAPWFSEPANAGSSLERPVVDLSSIGNSLLKLL